MNYKEFRLLRRKLEISQSELSRQVGYPQPHISVYELHGTEFSTQKIQELKNILLTEEKAQYSCRDSE